MMLGSLGVMGDLCAEAEWIWRRMLHLRVSLQTCRHSGLGSRLRAEARLHGRRCQQIQHSLQQGNFSSSQLQFTLLSELLDRSFQQSQFVQAT